MPRPAAQPRGAASSAARASTMTLGVSKSGSPAARPITCAHSVSARIHAALGRVDAAPSACRCGSAMQAVARTHRLPGLLHGAREVGQRHRLALVERSHARVDAALDTAGGRRSGAARRDGSATAWGRQGRRRVSGEARGGCRAAAEARTGGVARAAPQLRRRAEARARGCAQRLHSAGADAKVAQSALRAVRACACLFAAWPRAPEPISLAACSLRTRHGTVRGLCSACARFAAPCARKPSRASLCAPLRLPRSAFLPPTRIARLDEAAAYIPRVRCAFNSVIAPLRPPWQRTAWVLRRLTTSAQRRLCRAGAAPARRCRGRQAARAGALRGLSA